MSDILKNKDAYLKHYEASENSVRLHSQERMCFYFVLIVLKTILQSHTIIHGLKVVYKYINKSNEIHSIIYIHLTLKAKSDKTSLNRTPL